VFQQAPALSAAATPRLTCEELAAAINHADLEAALACFSPGACLVAADGSTATGEAALRPRLWELIAHGAQVEIDLFGVIVADEVALAHECWEISYEGRRASRSPQSAQPTLVMRLLAGKWKLAIAAPWGTPASKPLQAIWP
jgi:ketosteroid isomerase-like protein